MHTRKVAERFVGKTAEGARLPAVDFDIYESGQQLALTVRPEVKLEPESLVEGI
jgi:hypothetical protein